MWRRSNYAVRARRGKMSDDWDEWNDRSASSREKELSVTVRSSEVLVLRWVRSAERQEAIDGLRLAMAWVNDCSSAASQPSLEFDNFKHQHSTLTAKSSNAIPAGLKVRLSVVIIRNIHQTQILTQAFTLGDLRIEIAENQLESRTPVVPIKIFAVTNSWSLGVEVLERASAKNSENRVFCSFFNAG